MDVLVGPTFTIDVSPPQSAAAAAAAGYSLSQAETQRLLLKHRVVEGEEEEEDGFVPSISISNRSRLGLSMAGSGKSLDDSSDGSSSVGAPDDSDEEEDGESNSSSGASSSLKKGLGSLGSMDALEDSLPSKRGLSNYFTGKSKSFASLSDACLAVSKAKDLEKPEHPFNKRRRILMANKWSRRSSFYSWHNPKSMPLLTLNEDDDESGDHNRRRQNEDDEDRRESRSSSSSDKDEDEDEEDGKRAQRKLLQERKFNNSFKSHSCFSLTDLQEQQRQRELNLPPRR